MPLLTSILVLIVTARCFGALMVRFKQPAIVGEMLAGVILGPSVLGLVGTGAALGGISELTVFLLVVAAGLEMNFSDVANALKGKGIVVAVSGFLIPFLAGIWVGQAFGLDTVRTIFLGLCVSITALPVAVRILQSFHLLNSDIAKYSIATAIANDLAAMLIFGVLLNVPMQGPVHLLSAFVAISAGKLLVLGVLVLGIHWLLELLHRRGFGIERFSERVVSDFSAQALFGLVIIFALALGSVSEVLGFHFIVGAFFGALLMDRRFFVSARFSEVEKTLGSVTGGFLSPLFFASLGLEFNATSMHSIAFVSALLAVSILSKFFAGWLSAKLIGVPEPQALGIGIILNGRGLMELVIASIAFKRGLIDQGLYSDLVLMGVVTTILTPILLRVFVIPRLQGRARTS